MTRLVHGSPVLRVPPELLERVSDFTTYPSAASALSQLTGDAGKLNADGSAYIILSSDVGTGEYEYAIR